MCVVCALVCLRMNDRPNKNLSDRCIIDNVYAFLSFRPTISIRFAIASPPPLPISTTIAYGWRAFSENLPCRDM